MFKDLSNTELQTLRDALNKHATDMADKAAALRHKGLPHVLQAYGAEYERARWLSDKACREAARRRRAGEE